MYNAWEWAKDTKWIKFIEYVKKCDKNIVESFLNPNFYKPKWIKIRREKQLIQYKS